jgi:hypothetical protein
MEIFKHIQDHWVQIAIVWFAIQNFLKALQDSLDAMPKGLSFLAEVVYLMNNIGSYLFLGNRPQSIQGASNDKVSISSGTITTSIPGPSANSSPKSA